MNDNRISKQIATLVFPAQCPFCKTQRIESQNDSLFSDSGERWCKTCEDRLVGSSLDRCLKCGAATGPRNPFPLGCRLCQGVDLRFDHCVAIGNYQGRLQELVIEMKRCHDEVLAIQMGRLLGQQVDTYDSAHEFDLLVPIPTHWLRKFRRGFHGASVIADGLSSVSGIRKSNRVLFCKRTTKKQGMLSTPGRFANVRGAFNLHARANVNGKKILLVDDVMTSGATASEAAKMLYRAGAASVSVAVAARGARGI